MNTSFDPAVARNLPGLDDNSGKNYYRRDTFDLDKEGGYFMRHLMAMTEEDLHGKFEIAAELAQRDHAIDFLVRELASAERQLQCAESCMGHVLAVVVDADKAQAEASHWDSVNACEASLVATDRRNAVLNAAELGLDITFGA